MTRKRQIGILISDLRSWLRSGFVCLCLLPLLLTALPARASDQITAANDVITSMTSQVEAYLETDSGNIKNEPKILQNFLIHILICPRLPALLLGLIGAPPINKNALIMSKPCAML